MQALNVAKIWTRTNFTRQDVFKLIYLNTRETLNSFLFAEDHTFSIIVYQIIIQPRLKTFYETLLNKRIKKFFIFIVDCGLKYWSFSYIFSDIIRDSIEAWERLRWVWSKVLSRSQRFFRIHRTYITDRPTSNPPEARILPGNDIISTLN